MDADNWALVTDLYELTMANGSQDARRWQFCSVGRA